MEICLSFRRT